MISAAQALGDFSLMASYARLLKLKGGSKVIGSDTDYEASQYSVGLKYALNGTFCAYAYYTAIDNKAQQDANLGQAPLYSNGLGTSSAYLSPGDDPRAFGLGLLARF